MPTYTLQGFVFAFKVEENNVIPRAVAWSDGTLFLKNDYDRLFEVRNRLRILTPSFDEMKHKWWRMSLEYFHNLSKAKVHREVDVRTNVHHDVDEGLSVPDVHHDVEEGLSVPELLKKISDMQRDFQSRITAPSCGSDVKAGNKESMCIDSSVKTSCATDINANNVYNDSMDFNHDPKVSSKNCEAPLAGAEKIAVDALMKISNFDIPKDVNISLSYKLPYYCHNLELSNDSTVTHIETDDKDCFKMVFIAFGVAIRSFKYHKRPLIIIDATNLKGRYEGTNLLAVGEDDNNQIIPIAPGVSQGETGPSWTWHLMMNYKLKSIKMQCLFWKMCKAYTVEVSRMEINKLRSKTPDVYEKLIKADGPLDELSDWAKEKIRKRMQKSLNWVVVRIAVGRVYKVDDCRRIQTVELCNGTCTCRKWKVLGLPCGHVLAICRVIGLIDCNRLAKGWFMRIALKGTYQDLVYPVGEVSSWQIPNYLPVVKPSHMDKQPSGRPKNMKRIRSQGEELVTVICGRCMACGHNRQGCRETISYIKERTYPKGSSQ
uniref:SWIM-type domain-containing protein n=1 Tax=Tanacetum cinerariifolium TaxID=118510 RepID=A0A6L2JJ97_TANCI|nr:hypothetical protein [Tanacetum cinerariifolium]